MKTSESPSFKSSFQQKDFRLHELKLFNNDKKINIYLNGKKKENCTKKKEYFSKKNSEKFNKNPDSPFLEKLKYQNMLGKSKESSKHKRF